MKSMVEYKDNFKNDVTFEYVTDVTDIDNLSLVHIVPSYECDFEYEFIPTYDDEYYD